MGIYVSEIQMTHTPRFYYYIMYNKEKSESTKISNI